MKLIKSKQFLISVILLMFLQTAFSQNSSESVNKKMSHNEIINMDIEQLSKGTFQKHFLIEINKERTTRGISPLSLDKDLCKVAQTHANYMSKDRYGHLDDQMRGGAQRIKLSPYNIKNNIKIAGENIAFGPKTIKQLIHGWMHSSGHRKNILRESFKDMGIAYKKGQWTSSYVNPHTGKHRVRTGLHFVQNFAAKR